MKKSSTEHLRDRNHHAVFQAHSFMNVRWVPYDGSEGAVYFTKDSDHPHITSHIHLDRYDVDFSIGVVSCGDDVVFSPYGEIVWIRKSKLENSIFIHLMPNLKLPWQSGRRRCRKIMRMHLVSDTSCGNVGSKPLHVQQPPSESESVLKPARLLKNKHAAWRETEVDSLYMRRSDALLLSIID
jgi:hypothetical protein